MRVSFLRLWLKYSVHACMDVYMYTCMYACTSYASDLSETVTKVYSACMYVCM
jgi:hypothetical protein